VNCGRVLVYRPIISQRLAQLVRASHGT
jgi:hypothetical protein